MYMPIYEMQMNLIVFLVDTLLSSIFLGGFLLLSAIKLALMSKAKVEITRVYMDNFRSVRRVDFKPVEGSGIFHILYSYPCTESTGEFF